jgi:hypothetical protein
VFCKRCEQTGLQTVHYKYEKRQKLIYYEVMAFSYTEVNGGLRTKSTESPEEQSYF